MSNQNDITGLPKDQIMTQISAMDMKADLGTAIFIASSALALKKTWNGEPYITHCLHVADIENEHLTDDEKIAGVLHDLIEDTDWTYEDLEAIGFSSFVIEAVRGVTKDKESGEKYLDGMKRCSYNPTSRKIKRKDNKHNMDLTRSARTATPKQKYLYHISATYHKAVDKGVIPAGEAVWKFLRRKEFAGLLTDESFPYIAAATLEPVPASIAQKFSARPGSKTTALTPA